MALNTARKIIVEKLSANFRECTSIVPAAFASMPAPGQAFVKNLFLGINASDINFTNGKYLPGVKPPFDAGFEAVGHIVAIGEGVRNFRVGDPVAYSQFGAFSEMKEVDVRAMVPLPKLVPEALTLLVSGLTASIALEEVGQIKANEVVLVTAAAGATGSYAVQLAKQAGCHVIGTCSSDDKVKVLRELGCDRPVNYKKENLFEVLRKEYPKGVDVVYEGVGGDMFDTALNNLAVRGRLVVIGFISGYQDGGGWDGGGKVQKPIAPKLLGKSASVRGFFLDNYRKESRAHMAKLLNLIETGKIKALVDPAVFTGLEGVADAIDYMYAGKNVGKVIVRLNDKPQSKL